MSQWFCLCVLHGTQVDKQAHIVFLIMLLAIFINLFKTATAFKDLNAAHLEQLIGENGDHNQIEDEADIIDEQNTANVVVDWPIWIVIDKVSPLDKACKDPNKHAKGVDEDRSPIEHERLW